MAKTWKPGDTITYDKLNELQRKADDYDDLLAEYAELLKELGELDEE
jgi:hypothetical protein